VEEKMRSETTGPLAGVIRTALELLRNGRPDDARELLEAVAVVMELTLSTEDPESSAA
jgi:hypothetical protein